MSDTATVEPGAAVEITAPRGMPSASVPAPDVSDSGDGGESYNPAQDTAAAFKALQDAKAPPAETPAPETPAEVATAAAEASLPDDGPPVAPESDPTDAKLNRVFNRIAALEKERDEARVYASRLAERAKHADELETKFAKLKADPREWMQESGWNQDTLADFILQGDRAVTPQLATVEQQQKALAAEVQQLRAERDQANQARRIDEFVSSIPGQLGEHKSKLPTLTAYFDNDAELAQQVFNVMRTAYQDRKTELTVFEAAQGLENVLANQAKRFARRASSETPTTSTAPATKPAPTLTNKSTASPSPASTESDGHSLNFKAAVETLRAARTKN